MFPQKNSDRCEQYMPTEDLKQRVMMERQAAKQYFEIQKNHPSPKVVKQMKIPLIKQVLRRRGTYG